jgi:flavin reductase (DIM6/NTAB) family NADH-FMN oxidoreductase RutF
MSKREQLGVDAALRHIPYGVHVVTTRAPQGDHGLTASWVMQVSKDPPMIAVALQKDSRSAGAVAAAGAFALNILSVDGAALAEKFFTPVHRFDAPPRPAVSRGALQMPLLGEAIGWLECQLRNQVEVGDHILFIGEVVAGDLKSDTMPLTTITAGLGYGGVKT